MTIKNEKLTIHTIRDIYKEIQDEFLSNDKIKISFENVDEIDLSGLQLLVSLKKSCDNEKKQLQLINIKEELLFSFELSGIDQVLGV
jgi:anti-anti-sigma factor